MEQEPGARPGEASAAPRALSAVWRAVAARRAEALSAGLLLLMGANLLSALPRKSITNDEIVHIPAGYYHLVDGNFQINNEHPPLAKMWAALPLLLIQPDEPEMRDVPPENFSEHMWRYQETFWPGNDARHETITFWTRAMSILVTLALGALIFSYARGLFGERAAVLAVALFAFEPTLLAHGRIVHTDVPAALVYLLFFVALRAYARAPGLRRALLLGLACGAAMVTKFSMVVLAPAVAAAGLVAFLLAPRLGWRRGRLALHATLIFITIWLVVNTVYFFQSLPIGPSDVQWVRTQSAPSFDRWMAFFAYGSKVWPSYYLFGLYNVTIHNQYGHFTSLLGQYRLQGWWYYFPVAFALKTTLPFLLVAAAALGWSVWRLARRREARLLWVLAPLSAYAALSMSSNINIGIRHFLPAYPFLFILGGVLLDGVLGWRRRATAVALVALALGWGAAEALRAYPHYVPYMNQLASARPHWWYLSDSNVEWGDDNRELAEYLRSRGETQVRGAVLGAWGVLRHYGVHYAEIFPKPGRTLPETHYVAVGASFLNGSTVALPDDGSGVTVPDEVRVNYFDEYRRRTPEAVFGNSIYLYRVK